MPEVVSFTSLTRTAFKDFIRGRSFWWLAIPVGGLIAASSFFTSQAEKLLGDTGTGLFTSWLTHGPDTQFLFFLGLSLAFTFLQSPLRGITVLLLQFSHLNHSSKTLSRPKQKDYLRAARTAFFFESGFWLSIITIGAVILTPSFFAWKFNRDALAFVSQIGFILFFGLSVYLYLIKELSLIYGLLGKTTYQSALELGFRIFRRHSFLTLLFFTYLSLLALIATLCANTLIQSLPLPPSTGNDATFENILMLPFFGIYFIFDQALRLAYFRKIASPPQTPSAKVTITEPATGMTNI